MAPLHLDAQIIGREHEITALAACISAERHVLLEGPVGVGKTALARAVCQSVARGFYRVDGDGRYSEARLVGQFDPPSVLSGGYREESFLAGPLVRALRDGAVLFINELNRMPEGVQNVLLPAMDEGLLHVPQLGTIRAKAGFLVIASQNPAEFVATGALSEALLDRFELVKLAYQPEEDERRIVAREARCSPSPSIIAQAVSLVRATRNDPRIRRGASVRAAIAIADLAVRLDGDVLGAAALALPTRVEFFDTTGQPLSAWLDTLVGLKKKAEG